MKKILFFAAIASAFFVSCDDGEKDPPEIEYSSDVELNFDSYRLPVGDSRTFIATVRVKGTTVTWKSGDESIATVDAETGLVTAIAEGIVLITADPSKGRPAECEVTVIEAARNCALGTPGWGESLGRVYFRTARIWTVGAQQWSDVVMAERCAKQTFSSIDNPAAQSGDPYLDVADCKDNIHEGHDYGHLFSWPAVYRFQSELCPDGWRVPTREDFYDLDISFGGTGEHTYNPPASVEYIDSHYYDPDVWGGEPAGYCGYNGNTIHQGEFGCWWSQTQYEDWDKWAWNIDIYQGGIGPGPGDKYIGNPVRCVRDI